jgi:8-oxo-dGTP diphosphatase
VSSLPTVTVLSSARVNAPPTAVKRALLASHVWLRAARVAGGRLEVAGAASELRPGGALRLRTTRITRPLVMRIGGGDGLPELTVIGSILAPHLRIRFDLTETPDGTTVTVQFTCRPRTRLLNPLLRRVLGRYGGILLGIVTLTAREPLRVVAAVVINDGRLLVTRRKPAVSAAGRWELPGGKVEIGEGDREALRRELREELGVEAEIGDRIGQVVQVEPGVLLIAYRTALGESEITLIDHDELRWVDGATLGTLDLLEADRQLVAPLRDALA